MLMWGQHLANGTGENDSLPYVVSPTTVCLMSVCSKDSLLTMTVRLMSVCLLRVREGEHAPQD